MSHPIRIGIGLLVAVVMAAHLAGLVRVAPVEALDQRIHDLYVTATAAREPHPVVVIVEPSAARGWHRGRLATLLEKLVDRYGASVVAVDEVFDQPDPATALPLLERLATAELKSDERFRDVLESLRPQLDHDAALARALGARPVVLAIALSSDPTALSTGVLPAGIPGTAASAFARLPEWRAYRGVLAGLQHSAPAGGLINVERDRDGVVRRVPAIARVHGEQFASLGIAAVAQRHRTGIDAEGGVLRVGPHRVPVDEEGRVLVPRAEIRRVPAEEVLADRLPEQALRGRIVFVAGAILPGQSQTEAEIHAGLAAGIVDGAVKRSDSKAPWISGLILLVVGAALAHGLSRRSAGWVWTATGGLALAALLASAALWGWAGVAWLPGAMIVAAAGLALVGWLGRLLEDWRSRRLTAMFGEYVSPEQVRAMARDPDQSHYRTTGRNEVLTVLFADLRNFTRIAEGMPPDTVRRFLADYLTEMSAVVHRYGGTVDKYMGDSVMAFWGAPKPDPDHAANAVRAALAMQALVRGFGERGSVADLGGLAVGVGVNTGLVSLGDMGSKLRRTYTAIGDPVNLASRLESLTKYYGVGIIIGEPTRELVPDLVCRELDLVKVKGRDEVVAIYEPLGFRGAVDEAALRLLEIWNQMVVSYRHRRWREAAASLALLEADDPARAPLYARYAERIARLERDPPPEGWDAVMVFDRK